MAPPSGVSTETETAATPRSSCVCTAVRRADRTLNRLYDEALRPSGLLTTQYALLSTLARVQSPLLHSQLAEAQAMASTTLTRTLRPLVRDGLVRIESGDDRRTRHVAITPEGRAALDRARPLWRSMQDHILTEVGAERIEHLLDELADLVARVRGTDAPKQQEKN